MMRKILFSFVFCIFSFASSASNDYTLIIGGYDWGPAVNKVVLNSPDLPEEIIPADFRVTTYRSADGVEMSPRESSGERMVIGTYRSDENGQRQPDGNHLTLVLFVGPDHVMGSPIKYIFKNGRGSNKWIDYRLEVLHSPSGQSWKNEKSRIFPLLDQFNLSGKYQHADGTALTYGYYRPPSNNSKIPLIIWLHGGGEGGTDPSIPLVANKALNYASPEIQVFFGGAYVLAPQTPTFWMQNAEGQYTTGAVDDVYNQALMGLIQEFVKKHPEIDPDRIYIGGCSNGGYMSLKLILLYPDYFAAGYISALAYQNQFISDAQIESIKNVPIWFVHAADDPVTVASETVIPLYERLRQAKAPDVHLSLYDHVYDITGFFGGKDYHYSGHWSWIYSHANHARYDYNGTPVMLEGKPVTIMEWMAAQDK